MGGGLIILLIIPEYYHYYQFGYDYPDAPYPEVFGKGVGAMMSALLIMSTALTCLVYIVIDQRNLPILTVRRRLMFSYLAIFLTAIILFWISSRGAIVSILLCLVYYIFVCLVKKDFKKIILISLIVLISAPAIYLLSFDRAAAARHYTNLGDVNKLILLERENKNPGEIVAIGSEANKCQIFKNSIIERVYHLQLSFDLFLDNPLLGVGANNYGKYSCHGKDSFPHNVVIQVFVELGAFVGLIFLYIFAGSLYRINVLLYDSQFTNDLELVWLGLFSICQVIFSLFSGDYFTSVPVYFVMGIASSISTNYYFAE